MSLLAWAWLITLPGLALTALGLPADRRRAGLLSLPGPVVLLVVAVYALLVGGSSTVVVPGWLPFLPDGAFRARADELSALMLVVLGFVATLVYVYSLGYMADDPGRRRFFAYLDLFVAAMALLVLAGNLAVLLIGWTGVGLSSFLLISFWRDRPGTLAAGLQALAANAIGDAALLLAAVLVPTGCGALTDLATPACTAGPGGGELLAALVLVAAAAKSAQGPLYFWLPSAMAGPTPISALIHAATMVAAGVYLLVRTHGLVEQAPVTASWIAGVGVATALAAGVASLLQANFKRAIAYSTVAQLGYMFAAIGVGSALAAIFHLTTHAAFKALLFLSAGVVIHGMGGEERLDRLIGAGRRFPSSRWGFLVGALSLIGVPFTAGAFSKDAIIEVALERQPLVGWLLLGGAALTGLYIGRLWFSVYQPPRWLESAAHEAQPAATHASGPAAAAHQPGPGVVHQTGLGVAQDTRPGAAHETGSGAAHETGSGAAHEPHPAHHGPAAERLMDWSLVPLAAAALLAGYLAWPGAWLQHALGSLVGETHPLQPIGVTGLAAFGLGAAGFALSAWLAGRVASPRAVAGEAAAAQGGWVDAVAGVGYAAAARLAAVQSGHLARYAFGSLVALAGALLLRVMLG